ncbi:MAG: hypothetical protein ABEK59_04220 [Halobacteria archaeon]
MVVVLVGVGADTTNAHPTPPVYEDGRFEYVPIPEFRGPEGTVEESTYGNSSLRHNGGNLADLLEYIEPGNYRLDGSEMERWPLHQDPNFDHLTYGETTSRAAYTSTLSELSEDDVLAFYTGLDDGSGRKHRYVIGYFTVNRVVDLRDVDGRSFEELPKEEKKSLISDHRHNAHAKRYLASGELHDGDGVVILDGKEPGGLLDRAFRISKSVNGHYYLRDDLQESWNPVPSGRETRNAYLGGIKQIHELKVESDVFVSDCVEKYSFPGTDG